MASEKESFEYMSKYRPTDNHVFVRVHKPEHREGTITQVETRFHPGCVRGTVFKVGYGVDEVREGDEVFLDYRQYHPDAQYIIAHVDQILAVSEPTQETVSTTADY